MNKYILSVALIAVFYGSGCLAKKNCDLMKDFQPEFNDIKGWGEERCKKQPELTQADMDLAQKCYKDHIQKFMDSDNKRKVHKFLEAKVFIPSTLKVCKDESEQKRLKDDAMGKDLGMSTGMKCKKEIEEGDCPAFKKAFQAYNACVKAG